MKSYVREILHQALEKQAEVSIPDIAFSALKVSAVLGIPIGVAAHLVGKELKNTDIKQKNLRKQRDFYRDATEELESQLSKNAPYGQSN